MHMQGATTLRMKNYMYESVKPVFFLITWSTIIELKAVLQPKVTIAALLVLGLMKVASYLV